MYEDYNTGEVKKSEEEDDSDTWSYSYPSYSRFNFTGKTKSRLGRNYKTNRTTTNKDEIKTKEDSCTKTDSTLPSSNSHLAGSTHQIPKTPSWLRGDTHPSSNPFTPGTNIFKQSCTVYDNQPSVNASGIDVPSQSNFLYTLKHDFGQTSSCKRNLAFSNIPFESEDNKNSALKELNNIPKKPSFPKFIFSNGTENRDKENFSREKKLENDKNKEGNSFDPSWNQLKRICDAAISYAPGQQMTKGSDVNMGTRNQFGTTTNELYRSNIFAPFNEVDRANALKKDDDELSNTPLDLSSGENLSNKNVLTGNLTDPEVKTSPLTQMAEQEKNIKKECDDKDNITKNRTSSDDISSFLPKFLAQTNISKVKVPEIHDRPSSEPPVTVIPVSKSPTVNINNHTPLVTNALHNQFFLPLSKNAASSHLVLNTKSDNGVQKSPFKEHLLDNTKRSNSLDQNRISKEPLPSNKQIFSNEPAQINRIQCKPVETNSAMCSSLSTEPIESIGINRDSNIDLQINSLCHETKLYSLTDIQDEKQISNNESGVAIHSSPKQNPTLGCNSSHSNMSDSSKEICNPGIEVVVSKSKSSTEQLGNPLSCDKRDAGDAKNVLPASSSSHIKCTSSQSHSEAKQPESNLPGPLGTYHQYPFNKQLKNINDALKPTPQSHIIKESKIQVPVDKTIESSGNCVKQRPIQQQTFSQKEVQSENREIVVSNQLLQNVRLSEFGQHKTYLAPQYPPDNRIMNNNSNNSLHPKPELHQQISTVSNVSAIKKPQINFKMPAPRGLPSRANTELYVNNKVYTILSMLGRGGSSEVYQVLDPRNSKLMAVKCVDLSMVDKTIADGYLNEIDLLSKLQSCSSVIRMFDYEYVQEYKMLYVVMEKGDTDLSQLIRDISKTKKISMSMIIYYWTEMLNAVKDIHDQGIIHSDLKPANFLLVSGRLKLIDFGIASSQGDMTSVVKEVTTGTWNYMSPEAIRNTSSSGKGFKITYKSDVWSLGCILYNLVYGKTPFSHITNTWGKLQAIADPNHCIEFPDVGTPVVLAQALQSCFHRDPKQRPTVAELLSLQYHATCDSNYIGRQLQSILPHDWWLKVSHLFPEIRSSKEDKKIDVNTG